MASAYQLDFLTSMGSKVMVGFAFANFSFMEAVDWSKAVECGL